MVITLPMPPGINRTYKVGNGRFYKSAEAKQWEEDAYYLIKACRNQKRLWSEKVHIIMSCTKYRELDIDAPIKIVLDALENAGLFKNDKDVMELIILKKFNERGPEIQIML